MAKKDIILLHGWATRASVWNQTKNYLADRFQIWTPDLPLPDSSMSYKELIIDYMDKEGIKEAIFIGWSLGSLVAIELATTVPQRIKALALVNGTSKFSTDETKNWGIPPVIVKRMKKRLKVEPEKTIVDFFQLMFSSEEIRKSLDTQVIHDHLRKDKPWEIGEGLIGLDYLLETDLRDKLDSIEQPVLILHGDEDEICPVEGAYYLNDHIKDSKLVIFQKSGHIPFLTQEGAFNAQLGEWLDGLSNT